MHELSQVDPEEKSLSVASCSLLSSLCFDPVERTSAKIHRASTLSLAAAKEGARTGRCFP